MTQKYQIGPIVRHARSKTTARDEVIREAAKVLNWVDDGVQLFWGLPPSMSDVAAILIYPTLGGWAYQWLERDGQLGRTLASGFGTQAKARYAAIKHISQLIPSQLGTPQAVRARTSEAFREWAFRWMPNSDVEELWNAVVTRWGFEERYHMWRTAGVSETEAHQQASAGRVPPVVMR